MYNNSNSSNNNNNIKNIENIKFNINDSDNSSRTI